MHDLVVSVDGIRSFCSFRTEGRLYGIDATQVREVSAQIVFTPVAQAPSAVRGLANLRSKVYLVVDIRPVLGLPPVECTTDSRFIVLKPHLAENLGILVEHGGDIVRVNPSEIEETQSAADRAGDNFSERSPDIVVGVCKLEGELMNIIDSTKLIEALQLVMK